MLYLRVQQDNFWILLIILRKKNTIYFSLSINNSKTPILPRYSLFAATASPEVTVSNSADVEASSATTTINITIQQRRLAPTRPRCLHIPKSANLLAFRALIDARGTRFRRTKVDDNNNYNNNKCKKKNRTVMVAYLGVKLSFIGIGFI